MDGDHQLGAYRANSDCATPSPRMPSLLTDTSYMRLPLIIIPFTVHGSLGINLGT
ncbi:hypothetical protein LX36DRAFT_655243 [Colletotrichum falcatum]|nr:hypothetical protein LX36DRAFT_655243 [Colletotrichum falcatum]